MERKKIHDTADHDAARRAASPSIGEMTMNAVVLRMPGASSGAVPALAIAAPIMPPISACEELEGMP